MKLFIEDFFNKLANLQETADLVSYTEEILNGKLHLCAVDMLYYTKLRSLHALRTTCCY